LEKTVAINIFGIRVKTFFNSGFFNDLCDWFNLWFFNDGCFDFLCWLIGIFNNASDTEETKTRATSAQ